MVEFLSDNSFDIIVGYDTESKVVYWNKMAEAWFGISKEAAMGRTIEQLVPSSKDDPRVRYLSEAIEGKEYILMEVESKFRDAYYSQKILPWRNDAGKISGAVVIARDLTKEVVRANQIHDLNSELTKQNQLLEEKSQLLQAIFDTSPDFMGVLDKDLRYISINKSFELYAGNIVGKTLYEVFPQHSDSNYEKLLRKGLEGESNVYKNYAYTLRDGYCNLHVSPLKDHDGKVFGVLMVTQDITELKHLNDQLAENNDQLENINIELSSFTAAANHDLRKPLNKIQVFADFLHNKEFNNLSDTGKQYMQRLMSATRDAQGILSGTLDYYSSFMKVDSNEVVSLKEIIQLLISKYQLTEDMIAFEEVMITGNSKRLYTLFDQIIGNSVKFKSPERSLKIIITHGWSTRKISAFKEPLRILEISVKDNGIGFNEAYNEKVFDVFFKIHATHDYPGNGIGLSICRKIINKKGGMIVAEGKEQEGTTVKFSFPQ
jgi:PAS domain S-box-containing protein